MNNERLNELQEHSKRTSQGQLTDRDRQAVNHAARVALKHVSIGTWVGALTGAIVAFRFRLASALHKNGYQVPLRLMRGVAEHDAAYATEEGARQYRRQLLWKGAGWSMLGSFVGWAISMLLCGCD